MVEERLLNCHPIGLFVQQVVDLRVRHLDYLAPYSDTYPQERNSKHSIGVAFIISCAPSLKRGP